MKKTQTTADKSSNNREYFDDFGKTLKSDSCPTADAADTHSNRNNKDSSRSEDSGKNESDADMMIQHFPEYSLGSSS